MTSRSKALNSHVMLVLDKSTSVERYRDLTVSNLNDVVQRLQSKSGITENDAFLVTIFIDGQENASRLTNVAELKTRIRELEATGRWTFAFIGANVNLELDPDWTRLSAPLAYGVITPDTK